MSDQQQEPTYGDRMYAEVVRLTAALERSQNDYQRANSSLTTLRQTVAGVADAMRQVVIDNGSDSDYQIDRDDMVEWISALGGETTYEVVKTYVVEVTFEVELGADEPSEDELELHCSANNAEIIDQSVSERY